MKNNLLLVTTIAVFLVACGSSSNGGTSKKIPKPSTVIGDSAFHKIQHTNHSGHSYLVGDKDDFPVMYGVESENDFIIVNGELIRLNDERIKQLDSSIFEKTFIGQYDSEERFFFAMGNVPTEAMPNKGAKVKYFGRSLGNVEKNGKVIGALQEKSVSFEVDFENKTLTGRIADIDFNAKIKGNTFAGDSTLKEGNPEKDEHYYTKASHIEGGFYGNNAIEMAGSFAFEKNATIKTKEKTVSSEEKKTGVFQARKLAE